MKTVLEICLDRCYISQRSRRTRKSNNSVEYLARTSSCERTVVVPPAPCRTSAILHGSLQVFRGPHKGRLVATQCSHSVLVMMKHTQVAPTLEAGVRFPQCKNHDRYPLTDRVHSMGGWLHSGWRVPEIGGPPTATTMIGQPSGRELLHSIGSVSSICLGPVVNSLVG